ncbi:MAG: hypothetical protein Ct9H300mP11_18530 [Chloroflexota bacterium]|nr:MAG: hypothetical protein Ct9H300mP11_18530 [Chloroflexota bacterium]
MTGEIERACVTSIFHPDRVKAQGAHRRLFSTRHGEYREAGFSFAGSTTMVPVVF